jgi:hypothetical protein
MAQIVLTNAGVKIGAVGALVDESASVKSVTINYGAESPDATTMTKTTKVKKAGVKDWSCDIGFVNNVSASALDDRLFVLVGTEVGVELYANGTTADTDNPKYSGTGILTAWQPLQGSHGEVIMSTVHVEGSDTLSRADPS